MTRPLSQYNRTKGGYLCFGRLPILSCLPFSLPWFYLFCQTSSCYTTETSAVFQPDNPTALTEESLVDLLSLNKLEKFDYRHVEWIAAQSTLEVEFVTNGHPEKGYVGDEWYRFASNVFQSTTNVENLICHLSDPRKPVLGTGSGRPAVREERSQGTRAEDYFGALSFSLSKLKSFEEKRAGCDRFVLYCTRNYSSSQTLEAPSWHL